MMHATCSLLSLQLKVIWYVWHSALETKAIRKNGVVIIQNNLQESTIPSKLLKKYMHFVQNCMPIKVGARHVYVPSTSRWERHISKVKGLVEKPVRLRYIEHKIVCDRDLEDMSVKLGREYGIQKSCLPAELGGSVSFEQCCQEWVEERRSKGL